MLTGSGICNHEDGIEETRRYASLSGFLEEIAEDYGERGRRAHRGDLWQREHSIKHTHAHMKPLVTYIFAKVSNDDLSSSLF